MCAGVGDKAAKRIHTGGIAPYAANHACNVIQELLTCLCIVYHMCLASTCVSYYLYFFWCTSTCCIKGYNLCSEVLHGGAHQLCEHAFFCQQKRSHCNMCAMI